MATRSDWTVYVLSAGLSLLFGLALFDRFVAPLFAQELPPEPVRESTVLARIVGERLEAPASAVRFAEQRHGGDMPRLDLYGLWPTLAGYTPETRAAFDDVGQDSRIIFVSITPRETPTDMSSRLGTIYARLFAGEPWAGPEGLVGRRLADGSGYEGEELYFEPGSPRPFVARCFGETDEGDDTAPPTCIREIHFGKKLAALYRFRKTLLGEWRRLDGTVRATVEGYLVDKG